MKYHGIKPVYNVWLSKDDGKYFGPGVAMLIEGVKRTGSLSSAAKEIGMAYSKAWTILRNAERTLGVKLISSTTGGRHGGGAVLTPEGEQMLAAYTAFSQEVRECGEALFQKHFGGWLSGQPNDGE